MAQAAPAGSFANRTIIVTDAAGSIGRPLCLAIAQAGANVVVNDIGCSPDGKGSSKSPAEQLVHEIASQGFSVVPDTHNVATEVDKVVETAITKFGSVDVIMNNAGIITYGPIAAQDPGTVRKVFEANALGAIALCHYAWLYMKNQQYRHIINFTSESVFGMPYSTAYALSRGALLGVTKSLANEGRQDNILVNAIGPSSHSRMVADVIKDLLEEQQANFKNAFTGESNVPVILALASEDLKHSGQIWSSGNYSMSRIILETVKEVKPLVSMDECLSVMDELLDKDRKWAEPQNMQEFWDFKAQA
ncbi:uncharacterized protein A1O5_05627 [Cladophialophora psammophila CBS 110553]|uniref:3-oxoacyl-[acyl-carrier protein] reductase n=1 Tax=Cladophialophora psammophila CBS 110553 TaxID=1182543 RepID=W9WUE0_9EURO|nr:uncharacterized protein A1O5_05627 [Cladophialophora psammophila CBS 110553]EXJ71817.1 hypothetical protein A1O5_05627 [Cladophialophora psammophila CBS 110553]